MTDYEHKKLCLARYMHKHGYIDKLLPSVIKAREKYPRRKSSNKTWLDWWDERYNENYHDYVETMKNAKSKRNTEQLLSTGKDISTDGYELFRAKRRESDGRSSLPLEV